MVVIGEEKLSPIGKTEVLESGPGYSPPKTPGQHLNNPAIDDLNLATKAIIIDEEKLNPTGQTEVLESAPARLKASVDRKTVRVEQSEGGHHQFVAVDIFRSATKSRMVSCQHIAGSKVVALHFPSPSPQLRMELKSAGARIALSISRKIISKSFLIPRFNASSILMRRSVCGAGMGRAFLFLSKLRDITSISRDLCIFYLSLRCIITESVSDESFVFKYDGPPRYSRGGSGGSLPLCIPLTQGRSPVQESLPRPVPHSPLSIECSAVWSGLAPMP